VRWREKREDRRDVVVQNKNLAFYHHPRTTIATHRHHRNSLSLQQYGGPACLTQQWLHLLGRQRHWPQQQ
jgi:hypothetical protein